MLRLDPCAHSTSRADHRSKSQPGGKDRIGRPHRPARQTSLPIEPSGRVPGARKLPSSYPHGFNHHRPLWPSAEPFPALGGASPFRPPAFHDQPVICGTARVARAVGNRFNAWERCGHMSGLSARPMTAGLDEVRVASGLIKGARSKRVTGFSLSRVGFSSQGFIVCFMHLTSAGYRAVSSFKRL